MILTMILIGKFTCKPKKHSLLRRYLFTGLVFFSFFAILSGIQTYPRTLNNAVEDFRPEFIPTLPQASIGPTIENLTKTDPLEFGNYANITVDINHTDNGVDTVLIEIGGTNYSMTWVSGNEYNYTWQPSTIGNIPFTIYANASIIGDWNSLADSINVEDTTDPTLSNLVEVSGDPVEYNGAIYIRVNVTDLSTIDDVLIEFDGSNYSMTYLSDDMYCYTTSPAVGLYSYTIYANDTYGNDAILIGGTLTVSDTTGPTLSNIVETSGDPVEFNGVIYIRVNVTDLSVIDDVLIEFDGTNYSMTYLSDDMYYYTTSPAVGLYSYTIYANDTYGNDATPFGGSITVEDTTEPTLSNLVEVSGDPVEYNGAIYIRVNVTDLSTIDDVWIDFGGYIYAMTCLSEDMYYYTTSPVVGLYSYTIYANDTYGNEVIPITNDITVEDTIDPILSNVIEVSGDPVEFNGAVYIRVNVTDLSIIDDVWINFGGSTYSMTYLSDDMYYYTSSPAVGLYSYTIYANDTYGNDAIPFGGSITVEDTTGPTLSNLVEVSGDPVEYNGVIYIRVNVTDLSLIDDLWIDFDGTNYSMTYLGGDMYFYSASPAIGFYSYTIHANDTYGNNAIPIGGTITVEDTTAPSLSNLAEVSGDPTQSGENIYIRVNVIDLSIIDDVWIDFDGTNYSMTYLSDDMYYYTSLYGIGVYSYSIYANDTHGNQNSLTGFNIEVSDIAPPILSNVVEVSGDPTEYDGDVYIRVNVTHSLGVDSVWIDFNGTNYTMTLLNGIMYYYSGSYGINLYSYSIYANSSIGIEGSIGPFTIAISDATGPTLSNIVETSGDPVEYNGAIYIRVNVTDLSTIDDVLIEFDGANYSMTYLSDDMYYYTTFPAVGLYSYTIYANDTYGNDAAPFGGSITVEDTTGPILSNLVEVSGDPVEYNGTIYIRINSTDLSTVDSVWLNFNGTIYGMIYLSNDMYYYSGSHVDGVYSYSIYANDTFGNERMVTGDITVSEFEQTIIVFDPLDYPIDDLPADSDFNVTLPIVDNSTLAWAKVYFKITSNPGASAPGDDWTPIDLVNGQATITSEYYDADEILSYYFEIEDTDGYIFYVSSSGIGMSNATAQTNAFSFQITEASGGTPPFDILKWLPYILGVVGVSAAVFIIVGIKKSASKRDFPEMKEAGDAADALLEQQKSVQKEAIQAENDKDYYLAVKMYEKLIEIANELFKFGRLGAIDNIKDYKVKIAKYQKKAQEAVKPGSRQEVRQKATEYLKMAEDAEKNNDFGNALVIYHQILLLREEIKDKSQISATKAKIKNLITNIPDIRAISAKILEEAEEKYKAKEYLTAYADYRYLKTIFDALGDKKLISTIDKLISDVTKHL